MGTNDLYALISENKLLNTTCPPDAEFEQGGKCGLECTNLTKLIGPDSLTCDDGKWAELDFAKPTCEERECVSLNNQVKSGKIRCPDNTFVSIGGTCNLLCDEGYKAVGADSVTCMPNGDYD